MPTPALLALAVMGLSWLASAVAMALAGRATVPSVALTVAGAATVGATLADATGHADTAEVLLVLAWALALPLAVTAYPRLVWRHPVDFVALTTVVGAGGLAVAQPHREEVITATGVVLGCVLLAHTWWKLERGDAASRRALTWLAAVTAGAGLLGLFIDFLAPTLLGVVVAALAFALVGPAMLVGSARPDVVDVRVVVVQLVVIATVLLAYVALFTGLAALLQVLLGRRATVAELAVAGAVCALAVPLLQTVLHGVVDELLFGARSDPLEAATHVAGRSAGEPVLALRAVREALALPYAVLRVDGRTVASSGTSVTSTRVVPLSLGAGSTGELEVGLRPGDAAFSGADEHALALVASLVALTARSSALASALQEAREQSVTAIEEERRRLRRDLHDGLGPRLSGIAFTADAARNSVRTDPSGTEDLLGRIRAETTRAIEEVRGIVYAMRPPALDELGLVRAIRQQALGLRTSEGAPLRVDLTAPDDLPVLTAAVEVAAYRIVVEALTNAARHSGSDRATVRLGVDTRFLCVEVVDAGGDGGQRWPSGVGLVSMRERAQELGGALEAGPTRAGGRVVGRLPLGAAGPGAP
ncbi:MAG TPA: histidine kinase [Dermatophilaceae bacterium]|nr:histidine kinase [Dermatophilaceae bacterium]